MWRFSIKKILWFKVWSRILITVNFNIECNARDVIVICSKSSHFNCTQKFFNITGYISTTIACQNLKKCHCWRFKLENRAIIISAVIFRIFPPLFMLQYLDKRIIWIITYSMWWEKWLLFFLKKKHDE